jgi:hypothetical protein
MNTNDKSETTARKAELWADRHGIDGSATDVKAAFEDAASICLEENAELERKLQNAKQAAMNQALGDQKTRDAMQEQLFSIQLANRKFKEALTTISEFPTHQLASPEQCGAALIASDALSEPSEEQLIDRVIQVLNDMRLQYGDDIVARDNLVRDLKGEADNAAR